MTRKTFTGHSENRKCCVMTFEIILLHFEIATFAW